MKNETLFTKLFKALNEDQSSVGKEIINLINKGLENEDMNYLNSILTFWGYEEYISRCLYIKIYD